MGSFGELLRRITPRQSMPAVPAQPATPPLPPQVVVETPVVVEEPGFFRQALMDARVRWAKDVARAALVLERRTALERVVFTDQYIPPPPSRPSVETDAVGWWD
jgi:hypothetical protein